MTKVRPLLGVLHGATGRGGCPSQVLDGTEGERLLSTDRPDTRQGHSHGCALRTVADHLLGIVCVMLTNRTSYDPNHNVAHRSKTP